MSLLLKWLRPEVIPSPRRKNIPLGEKTRLFLYKRCILILKKWYSRYAFSDSIFFNGHIPVKLIHEHRDYDFENELKRLHIPLSVIMIDHTSGLSHQVQEKNKRRPYYKSFYFEDSLYLEVEGKTVSISHGQRRLFDSNIKGKLKESDRNSSISQYVFTGSLNIKSGASSKGLTRLSPSSSSQEKISSPGFSIENSAPSKRIGGLFEHDPLLEKKTEESKISVETPTSPIKKVEGVEIDESF